MRANPWLCVVAVLAAVILAVIPLYGDKPGGSPPHAQSVTVFPVVLGSGAPLAGVPADMSKNIAELVGLMLERGGMKQIEIADATFTPPEGDDLAKTAEAFGEFVKPQNLATDYALLGQYLRTPGKGVDEIRLVVTDRQGIVVLTERLDHEQLAAKHARGDNNVCLMLASHYAVGQLREFWKLADPNRRDAPQGKMAKLWNEKSALPPETERDAVKPRLDALKKNLDASTIAVFPIRGLDANSPTTAEQLAVMLTKAGLGRAKAVDTAVNFEIQPTTNQTRAIWDVARVFREYLRKHPPEADYALLATYRLGRLPDGKSIVGGIELTLCDRNGDWVLVTLRNSHHADFQQINPQSADDCNRLLIEILKTSLDR